MILGSNVFVITYKGFFFKFQDVSLVANYTKPPTVLVSPQHSTSGGNIDPLHNAISAWIEVFYYVSTAFLLLEQISTWSWTIIYLKVCNVHKEGGKGNELRKKDVYLPVFHLVGTRRNSVFQDFNLMCDNIDLI